MDIYLIRAISTSEIKSKDSADLRLHSTSKRFCFNLIKSDSFVFLSLLNVCFTTNSCIPTSFDNSIVEDEEFDFITIHFLNIVCTAARISKGCFLSVNF